MINDNDDQCQQEQAQQINTAWYSQARLHQIMSDGQRSVGNHDEANRLANAGNMAKIVADRLTANQQEAAQDAIDNYIPWNTKGSRVGN